MTNSGVSKEMAKIALDAYNRPAMECENSINRMRWALEAALSAKPAQGGEIDVDGRTGTGDDFLPGSAQQWRDAIQPIPTPDEALREGELLPCPFCGGDAEILDIEDGENAGGSCVSCKQCQASSNVEFEFKENFVSNWNRRAALSRARPDATPDEAKMDYVSTRVFEGKRPISKPPSLAPVPRKP